MSIHIDGQGIGSIFVGSQPVAEVYRGADLVWSAQSWDFFDDFERSTIGSAWQGSGGVIVDGALKKNTSAGTARYMINQRFDSDDLTVEVVIGTTQDRAQPAVILIGDPPDGDFVALSFSKDRFHAFGFDGGWPGYGDFPAQPLADGDKITLSRTGTQFTVLYNGTQIGTFTSGIARGAGYRRVGVEVNMALNFFVRWYGPTIDEVRVRTT